MGCAQTRNKLPGDEMEAFEEKLGFSSFEISNIKLAFFQTNGSNSVKQSQMFRVLEELGIEYEPEEEELFLRFLSAFEAFEEDEEKFYDLTELLIAIYLLSKSSQSEKAAALFDLYNDEAREELTRFELERVLERIIEVVFLYSEKLVDNEEGLVQLHSKIADKNKEELLPKVYSFFFSSKETLRRDRFVKLVELASKKPEFFDFTSPSSIRKCLLSFFSCSKKTQVELQGLYQCEKVKKSGALFEDDLESWSMSSSPDRQTADKSNNDSSPFRASKSTDNTNTKRSSIFDMF